MLTQVIAHSSQASSWRMYFLPQSQISTPRPQQHSGRFKKLRLAMTRSPRPVSPPPVPTPAPPTAPPLAATPTTFTAHRVTIFNFPSSLQLYDDQCTEMRSRILSVTSPSASPFEQIFQLGSAAVIIFEHSFYVFDQRRHAKDQQESVPSVDVALERYMASPHAIAVRDAVNTAVHANQGNSTNSKAKLLFRRFRRKDRQPKDYSGLLETILKIALEHRLPRP
ncbi:hypothetical protein DEU56DRAFT_920208 [Suillus clintonianus]|uniref:uncharacterized protein n=1 Tax=Suillus clintonianus TaxID=1904413 RepID=UPI001B8788CD|nr:uncharacterized protein DEU56DRAFT_920208 [Suillus clintonianus]KAG2110121.1 hypothetical protein DEU56DRAFT_920208 [Suillus clintonianus]